MMYMMILWTTWDKHDMMMMMMMKPWLDNMILYDMIWDDMYEMHMMYVHDGCFGFTQVTSQHQVETRCP